MGQLNLSTVQIQAALDGVTGTAYPTLAALSTAIAASTALPGIYAIFDATYNANLVVTYSGISTAGTGTFDTYTHYAAALASGKLPKGVYVAIGTGIEVNS